MDFTKPQVTIDLEEYNFLKSVQKDYNDSKSTAVSSNEVSEKEMFLIIGIIMKNANAHIPFDRTILDIERELGILTRMDYLAGGQSIKFSKKQ